MGRSEGYATRHGIECSHEYHHYVVIMQITYHMAYRDVSHNTYVYTCIAGQPTRTRVLQRAGHFRHSLWVGERQTHIVPAKSTRCSTRGLEGGASIRIRAQRRPRPM